MRVNESPAAPRSPGAEEKVLSALWTLLSLQAEKYSGADSTSLPATRVQELLRSVLYTLSVAAEADGVQLEDALLNDAEDALRRGRDILARARVRGREAWGAACLEAVHVPNVFYSDTLKSLGSFFARYDIYYSAHDIPCDIDYPLLCPVPETLCGISYVAEYIRRLRTEGRFVNGFPQDSARRLLAAAVPDYEDLMINICGPVLANAVGLALSGADVRALDISPEQRREAARLLEAAADEDPEHGIERTVEKAASAACTALGLCSADTAYIREAARGLCPRMREAVRHGGLSNIFISF